jgi:hypothetical protein
VVTVKESPGLSSTGPPANRPRANLRPLQVDEDADPSTGGIGSPPHVVVGSLVLRIVSVREIEASHVHARFDQLEDRLV